MNTYIVLEYAPAYGTSICEARRLTEEEKPKWAEWFQKIGFIGIRDTLIHLPHIDMDDLPKRKSDGQFSATTNWAWILTDEEVEYYKSLELKRATAEQERKNREQREREEREAAEKVREAECRAQFSEWKVEPTGAHSVKHTMTINGETLAFAERDIFDFGVVINPYYPIADGVDGGFCRCKNDRLVWDDVVHGVIRELTDNEAACVLAIRKYGRFSKSKIRM